MTTPSVPAQLEIAQDHIQSLQDILQDALYLAQGAHLPALNLRDLQICIDHTVSIFANLAIIRTRLERTHPHLRL